MQRLAVRHVSLDISNFPTRHNYGLALWQKHIERILAPRTQQLGQPVPARGIDRRFRVDRRPQWCARADRRRVTRRSPDWRAARQWQRRRPPTPTRPPTSVRSDLLRRSPQHGWSSPHPGLFRSEDQLDGARPARRQQYTQVVTPVGSGFGCGFYGMTGVLKQGRCAPHIKLGKRPVPAQSEELFRRLAEALFLATRRAKCNALIASSWVYTPLASSARSSTRLGR